jgi:uncharacterized protein
MTLRFRWDDAKAVSNQRKHRIRFDMAVRVFADPFAFSEQDRIEGGEYRWQTIGSIEGVLVLLVAHTVGDQVDGTQVINIISARRATRPERIRYEKEKCRHLRT